MAQPGSGADAPCIMIIYTGGTIGMTEDRAIHASVPFDFGCFIGNVPEVAMIDGASNPTVQEGLSPSGADFGAAS